VVTAYGELLESGELWPALLTTLQTLAIGFFLSVIVGITLGVILGRVPIIADVLEPYIDAVYATPRVVLVPLVILWWGIGDTGRLVLVFIGTVIPVILNTAIGVRNARPDLIEVGRAFGASERDLVKHVILPGSVPYLMAGMRIAVGRALVGVVIAEIFLDLTGLGGLVQTKSAYFRVDEMIAVVIVLAFIGTALMWAVGKLESRFSLWR
jgi:NitT/TauT family transport system permease protein